MANLSIGDLAQTFQLRRDNARLKNDLMRVTQELSTGRKSDLGKATGGDFGPLVSIDRQIASLKAYDTTAKEAGLFADAAQLSLERIQTMGAELAPRLISAELSGYSALRQTIASDAVAAFETTVEALNAQSGGRGLFGGTATNQAALADPQEMLAEIRAAVDLAAPTDAQGVADAVKAWFAPGGGFDLSGKGYTGGTDRLSGFRVAEGTEVPMSIKADDPEIREQLAGLAIGAMLKNGPLAGDFEKEAELARIAGAEIMRGQTGLSATRAELGAAQARIESATARNGAERTSLQIARSGITDADPYDSATEMQNLEVQLETLYTITARLSRLNLTDFLR
ncbi:flagellin [Roseitranquillus sediminis]|uniref:flagellin n=1 Tax=Roseitranquillus sediminis TaxID=2809051 RepID=UPI001D0C6413|nr:flagellin [Roseitranquillus sediminis]MBM9596103.1 hypothetical protein [Roseitranquillus sediminis]